MMQTHGSAGEAALIALELADECPVRYSPEAHLGGHCRHYAPHGSRRPHAYGLYNRRPVEPPEGWARLAAALGDDAPPDDPARAHPLYPVAAKEAARTGEAVLIVTSPAPSELEGSVGSPYMVLASLATPHDLAGKPLTVRP
jgi:hypothetical protein